MIDVTKKQHTPRVAGESGQNSEFKDAKSITLKIKNVVVVEIHCNQQK